MDLEENANSAFYMALMIDGACDADACNTLTWYHNLRHNMTIQDVTEMHKEINNNGK